MSTRTTRSGVKRSLDADAEKPLKEPSKRSKSNTKKPKPKPSTQDNDDSIQPSCNPAMSPKDKTQKPQSDASDVKEIKEPKISRIQRIESTGDIFSAPPQTLLLHACNTEGSWGAGIALAFRKHYPQAFKLYSAHCRKHGAKLLGTALLIPPQDGDKGPHFVGCLFTSRSKGKKKDGPERILEATGGAMRDVLGQVRECGGVGEVRMCRINSGLFGVPWERTKGVIEGIEVEQGGVEEIEVVSLAE